jgi:hypothetical protein
MKTRHFLVKSNLDPQTVDVLGANRARSLYTLM